MFVWVKIYKHNQGKLLLLVWINFDGGCGSDYGNGDVGVSWGK